MARKTQISKEVILQAALELPFVTGIQLSIFKTLSKEIGCSTQPIVWHFENMEGLCKALSEYANSQMCPSAENAIKAFEQVGAAFVHIAVTEPNLFRFLYLEGYSSLPSDNFDALVADKDNAILIKRISKQLAISEESAGRYLQNTIIYTHGIATIAATGLINASEEEMMKLVYRAADAFLVQEGVPLEKIPSIEEMQN